MLKPTTAAIFCAVCLCALSCEKGIEGSGQPKSEQRTVSEFTGIEIRGSADLKVQVGEAQTLTIETDDNLLPLVTTEVKNGRLIIGHKESVNSDRGLKVKATVQRLKEVRVLGSGDVDASGIKGERFSIVVLGSGDVVATGKVNRLSLEIKGSGDAELTGLPALAVKVDIAGSGDARVHATEQLKISIAGSGDVSYKGDPKVEQSIAGSGDVSKIGG